MTNDKCRFILILLLFLVIAPAGAGAVAPSPDYTTTYTITIWEDGSALWQIEYRTLLSTDSAVSSFEAYSRDQQSVYLPQVKDLMERSASQASVTASRPMAIRAVSGTAAIQESPTGKYGVVVYTFTWDGFARTEDGLIIGDAFTGGLYLPRDNTFMIRYPDGWTVTSCDPAADQQRDGLIWYGQRSFASGEPRVVLHKNGFPLLPASAGILLILIVVLVVFFWKRTKESDHDDPDDTPVHLTADEQKSVEDRILRLLTQSGGEQYQSEIVRTLGLPRSTVSAAVSNLHAQGVIVKVRRGRENLIRLHQSGKD